MSDIEALFIASIITSVLSVFCVYVSGAAQRTWKRLAEFFRRRGGR